MMATKKSVNPRVCVDRTQHDGFKARSIGSIAISTAATDELACIQQYGLTSCKTGGWGPGIFIHWSISGDAQLPFRHLYYQYGGAATDLRIHVFE